MRTRILICIVAFLALLLPLAPAQAIVNGEPDGTAHPYVGELLFYVPDEVDSRFDDAGSWFTCSGSLIDDHVVVTAGHCTYGIGKGGVSTTTGGGTGDGGTDVWISFAETPDFGVLPSSASYGRDQNHQRYVDWAQALDAPGSGWTRGTAHPHPQFDEAAFFEHDAGVLVLDHAVPQPRYATLPTLGLLDRLATNSRQVYTPVGYGLEGSSPKTSLGGDTRRRASVTLVSVNGAYGTGKGVSAKFSGNNGTPHTGGTCFGDSGGPFLVGTSDQLVAVNSYGISQNCMGGGGGYRLDQPDDLAFIGGFH